MFNIYDSLKAGILGNYAKSDLDEYLSYGMLTQDQYNELVAPFNQTKTNQPNVTNN